MASEYALASSVWTKDHARAMRMSKNLDFGCVWINTPHPARRPRCRTAASRSPLRQGPLRIRLRGLHPHQARHDVHRGLRRTARPETGWTDWRAGGRHSVYCPPLVRRERVGSMG
ncbi:aldehyde dehydrogenase family protein [Streptomyces cremeus]|uniref:aldehyde dehydrogenase family protein n=1 Tax=Streptomyces cremeus TaxID=66881 RepID=UPI003CD0A89D